MLIGLTGESCTGKATLANKIKDAAGQRFSASIQKHMSRGVVLSLTVPLTFLHVHTISVPKDDAFIKKQLLLFRKMWSRSAGMVYNSVAGIIAEIRRLTQHFSHHSCIVFLPISLAI